MEEGKKFSYLLVGLGIGVAAGVLLAPKSGADTRKLLSERAGDGRDYVKQRADALRCSAAGLLDRSKQAASKGKEQLAAAFGAGRSAYKAHVDATPATGPDHRIIEAA